MMKKLSSFQNLLLFDGAGAFGKFYVLLIILFSLNNIIVTLQYFSEEMEEYSFGGCEYINGINVIEPVPIGSWYETVNNTITFANEFRSVCNLNWKTYLIKSIHYCGLLFGSLVFGVCGDRYGRVLMLIFAHMISLIGNTLLIFTSSLGVHTIGHFCVSFTLNANATIIYVLVLEYVRASHRTFVVNVIAAIACALARGAAPWLLLLIQSWKHYTISISIFQMIVIFLYLAVPESYQWFTSFGQVGRAVHALKRVADYNEKELKREVVDYLRAYGRTDILALENCKTLCALFKSNEMISRIIIFVVKSFILGFSLGVMHTKLKMYGYSIFVNTSILAATLLPAAGLTLFIDKYGRRFTSSFLLFITGLYITISIVTLTVTKNNDNITFIFLVIIAIVFIKANALVNLQHAGEVLPTKLRVQVLSVVNLIGLIGYPLGPYFYYTDKQFYSLPGIGIGALLLLASLITMFLPETNHKFMPITLFEAEHIENSEELYVGPINNNGNLFEYSSDEENTQSFIRTRRFEYRDVEEEENKRKLLEAKRSAEIDRIFEESIIMFHQHEQRENEEVSANTNGIEDVMITEDKKEKEHDINKCASEEIVVVDVLEEEAFYKREEDVTNVVKEIPAIPANKNSADDIIEPLQLQTIQEIYKIE